MQHIDLVAWNVTVLTIVCFVYERYEAIFSHSVVNSLGFKFFKIISYV